MKILALDLATQTGWCYGPAGSTSPRFGSFQLPKTGDDLGTFALAARKEFERFVVPGKVELVCFERPLFLLRSKTNANTAMKLMGLAVILEMVCVERGVPVFTADQAAVKKHFVGRGNFGKSTKPYPMTVVCHDRGWETKNTDEADAAGIWDYTVHQACPDLAKNLDPLAMAAGGW